MKIYYKKWKNILKKIREKSKTDSSSKDKDILYSKNIFYEFEFELSLQEIYSHRNYILDSRGLTNNSYIEYRHCSLLKPNDLKSTNSSHF